MTTQIALVRSLIFELARILRADNCVRQRTTSIAARRQSFCKPDPSPLRNWQAEFSRNQERGVSGQQYPPCPSIDLEARSVPTLMQPEFLYADGIALATAIPDLRQIQEPEKKVPEVGTLYQSIQCGTDRHDFTP